MIRRPGTVFVVRVGFTDETGITIVHVPEEHERNEKSFASYLSSWRSNYPYLVVSDRYWMTNYLAAPILVEINLVGSLLARTMTVPMDSTYNGFYSPLVDVVFSFIHQSLCLESRVRFPWKLQVPAKGTLEQ
jgi:hypothetical protein